MTNILSVLVPSHFIDLLAPATGRDGIRMIPYDRDGVPTEDSRDVNGLFRWWISVEQGDALIRDHPRLDWIHTGSTGVDHILTPAFHSRSITLTNSRGVHAPSIAEWVLASILALEKDLYCMREQQRDRVWKQIERDELSTRNVVICGGGAIAGAVTRLLRPLGSHITIVSRSGRTSLDADRSLTPADLVSAAAECDWLIVALPLTRETRGLISEDVIARMPPHARIINVSRGEIVDQRAMTRALHAGRLGGAVLDVFDKEPLPADDPLWAMDNVLVLPHTTWKSPQVRDRQLTLFVENAGRRARGEPLLNVVDTVLGY